MLRTRVAIIFAAVFAVLGSLMAPSANAAPPCGSDCILQQLQSNNFVPVPPGANVRTVASDGSMLYFVGPRGLEFRLSRKKTTEVIENTWNTTTAVAGLASLLTGTGEAVAAMKIFPPWVMKAAGAAGIAQGYVQDVTPIDFTRIAITAMQRDMCLGATVEPESVKTILDRPLKTYAAMLRGGLGGAAAAMVGIRAVWFEPCSLNQGQLAA